MKTIWLAIRMAFNPMLRNRAELAIKEAKFWDKQRDNAFAAAMQAIELRDDEGFTMYRKAFYMAKKRTEEALATIREIQK